MVPALLACMCLFIRGRAHHPGLRWLSYDSFFRQQAAADPSLCWDTLHSDLFAITVANAAVSAGHARLLCRLCPEPDHASMDCALAQGLDSRSLLAMQLVHDRKPKSFDMGKKVPVGRSFDSTPLPGYRVNGCRFSVCLASSQTLSRFPGCPSQARKGLGWYRPKLPRPSGHAQLCTGNAVCVKYTQRRHIQPSLPGSSEE